MLKAAAATTAGVALFSGTASATDDRIDFDVECRGNEVKVTLKRIFDFDTGEEVAPVDLEDLQVVFGRKDVIDRDGNGEIARLAEIKPCVDGADWCEPVGRADPDSANTEETGDGGFCFTFDRDDVGLGDVAGTVPVVLAGTYFNENRSKDLGSFDGVTRFDPADCCVECRSGEELIVKYEWEGGKFVVEEGRDDNVSLVSVELDEDGEPVKACFSTTYCDLVAVVKAANEYEVTEADDGEVCVTAIDRYAISNVQFFCEEPDDYTVGNSGKREEKDSNGNNGNGRGRKR
jgi:hypothetical protein